MKLIQFERHHILAICEEINDRRLDNKIWESCLQWNEIAEDGEDIFSEWPSIIYDRTYFDISPCDWNFGTKEHCIRMRVTHKPDANENTSTTFFLWRENENDEFPMILKLI